MSARHKETIESVNAAFARNDIEGFLSFCADDVVFTMVGDRSVKGKDAIRQWMSSMDAEPPILPTPTIIAEGDSAIAHGAMTMKDKDGKVVPYEYCDIYRFRGDQIVELKALVVRTVARAETAGV